MTDERREPSLIYERKASLWQRRSRRHAANDSISYYEQPQRYSLWYSICAGTTNSFSPPGIHTADENGDASISEESKAADRFISVMTARQRFSHTRLYVHVVF